MCFRLGKLFEIINNELSPNVSKFIMFVEVNIIFNFDIKISIKPLIGHHNFFSMIGRCQKKKKNLFNLKIKHVAKQITFLKLLLN